MDKPYHLYEYFARPISVYDGDTMKVDIDLGFRTWIHNETIRLLGIDAPEVRGGERKAGLASREFLRSRVMNQERILLHTFKDKRGKYGRWLADVRVWDGEDWVSVNQEMLDSGYAVRMPFD